MPPTGGGGGGGLSTVSVTARLTGNGTAGSPLNIAGLPISFISAFNPTNTTAAPTANAISIWGFVLPYALTFANIAFTIQTADGAHNTDIGIYSKAGTLIANVGATAMASTGLVSFATLQGAQTIIPGLYLFAFTTLSTTLTYQYNSQFYGWAQNNNYATSAGAVLPNSITAVPTSETQLAPVFSLL